MLSWYNWYQTGEMAFPGIKQTEANLLQKILFSINAITYRVRLLSVIIYSGESHNEC